MRLFATILTHGLVALLLWLASSAAASHVDMTEFEAFAPPNAIDAVKAPRFDDSEYLSSQDEVIGLAIGGDARAYPIKVLVHHEIVNDVLGGVPVAVTYCPLCGVGLVYERTVAGQVLLFNVSGFLYRNNLVMQDNRTGSLWPQILGEGSNGTYHGVKLNLLPSTRTTWADWRTLHPDTKLLARPSRPICLPGGACIDPGFDYDIDPYAARYDYYRNTSTLQRRAFQDGIMHPKTFVLGLSLGGVHRAYPYPDLLRERVVNDVVGGEPVAIALGTTAAKAFRRGDLTFSLGSNGTMVASSGMSYDPRTGAGSSGALKEIPAFWGFWFAWKDLHPGTCVYLRGCPNSPSPGPAWAPLVASTSIALVAASVAVYVWVTGRSLRRPK